MGPTYPSRRVLYRRRVDGVGGRERQLAENEVRFRALNERLRDGSGTWSPGEGALELVCECGGWIVVRKRGEAGAIAAETDPRAPS